MKASWQKKKFLGHNFSIYVPFLSPVSEAALIGTQVLRKQAFGWLRPNKRKMKQRMRVLWLGQEEKAASAPLASGEVTFLATLDAAFASSTPVSTVAWPVARGVLHSVASRRSATPMLTRV